MIILGIDPGTATTGYGVVKIKKSHQKESPVLQCLKYGIISTLPSTAPEKRLRELHLKLSKIIREYQPKTLAVENIFFFKNLKTAMPVSQAKGVILLAAAQNKIPVEEISPLEVKMAVVGYGRADKKQVQEMVKHLFKLEEVPKPDDAADALAIAACWALKNRNYPQKA